MIQSGNQPRSPRTMSPAVEAPARRRVLKVEDVRTRFHTRDGTVHAVNGISFDLSEGELVGVVGESGSGKSATMMSLLKLLPMPPAEIVSGRARLDGEDLMGLDPKDPRRVRGAQVGFQDSMASLNPVLTVGYQLTEPLRAHLGMSREEARRRAVDLLERVGIPAAASRLGDFPHQFSGGMRQRVMIAIALACSPKVLIADEPTTVLDVAIQTQSLDLVKRLRRKSGMAIIWITHDLGVMAGLADRVMVMYGGLVVERASAGLLYKRPRHPFRRREALPVRALHRLDFPHHPEGAVPGLHGRQGSGTYRAELRSRRRRSLQGQGVPRQRRFPEARNASNRARWNFSKVPRWIGNNIQRSCVPEYDALVVQMSQTASLEERARLAKQMNDIIVQNPYTTPLIWRAKVSAHANTLKGVRMNAWDSESWNAADWRR